MIDPPRSVFSSGFLLNPPQKKLPNTEKIQRVSLGGISNTTRKKNRKLTIETAEPSKQEEDALLYARAWLLLHPLGVQ